MVACFHMWKTGCNCDGNGHGISHFAILDRYLSFLTAWTKNKDYSPVGSHFEKHNRRSSPSKLIQELKISETLDILEQRGSSISRSNVCWILQECTKRNDLECGRRVQKVMDRSELGGSNRVLVDYLIRLFASSSCWIEANQEFDKASLPIVYTWSAIISGHANQGKRGTVFELYKKLHFSGIEADSYVFLAVLKACTLTSALLHGRLIHENIICIGLQSDLFVTSALVDMYAKSGSLEEACQVFENMAARDIVSWDAMIAGYAQHGQGLPALECFKGMLLEGIKPDKITFLGVLRACSTIKAVEQGRLIHEQIIVSGYQPDNVLGSCIVDMYVKCGSLEEGCKIFDRMINRDVVSWSAMIAGYVENKCSPHALQCFDIMQEQGVVPDKVVFLCILEACIGPSSIEQGRYIHELIKHSRFEEDVLVASALVGVYAKCGSLVEARKVFDNMLSRDTVAWGAMVSGYAQQDESLYALECFESMQYNGIRSNRVTFLATLKACACSWILVHGRCIHEQIIEDGLQFDIVVGNTIIDMYVKCGSLPEAHEVFNRMPDLDVVSWNIMISAYSQCGNAADVVDWFHKMQHSGIEPDDVTFLAILTACSHVGLVDEGYEFFRSMRDCHNVAPSILHNSCMVDLLGRGGHFRQAEELVKETMPSNIWAWLTLLSACKEHGNVSFGRRCFKQLLSLDPNCAAGYVLMASIYATVQMGEDIRKVVELRKYGNAWRIPKYPRDVREHEICFICREYHWMWAVEFAHCSCVPV